MKPLSLKAVAAMCAGVSVLSVAAVAIAQDAPRAPQGRPGPAAAQRLDHRPDGRPGFGRFNPAERRKRLHDILQITPAQEAAFNAWQSAMKPPERPQRPDRQAMERRTTPERLDARLAMAEKHVADMRARADATKRFYNQLTPAQRTAFDAMPMGGRGHGLGGHGRGGHGFGRGFGHGGPGFGGPRGPGGVGPDRGGPNHP